MSNMSYCRFQNTAGDLDDCKDALEELIAADCEPLSREELAAAKRLVHTCAEVLRMLNEYRGAVDETIAEDDEYADALSEINACAEEELGFFDELVRAGGFELETAGSLRGGRRIWALAKVGEDARIVDGDMIRPYLLLATSYDASMATLAQFTSVRVVCNNTLTAAVWAGEREKEHAEPRVKIPHLSKFDAEAVRQQLTIATSSWGEFLLRTRKLAAERVDDETMDAYLLTLFKAKRQDAADADKVRKSKGYRRVMELFAGEGIGADMAGRTLWGAVNAVTQYVDHERGLRRETGLDAAWFGDGASLKDRALEIAQTLIAA